MKVVIFGATGFVSKSIVFSLRENGHDVLTVGRTSTNRSDHITYDLSSNSDVSETLIEALDWADYCFVLSAVAHKSTTDPLIVNRGIHSKIFYLLARASLVPKIIFFSTNDVLLLQTYTGQHYSNFGLRYALSKQEAESFLVSHYPKHVFVLRLGPVYSESERGDINKRAFFNALGKRWCFRLTPAPTYYLTDVAELSNSLADAAYLNKHIGCIGEHTKAMNQTAIVGHEKVHFLIPTWAIRVFCFLLMPFERKLGLSFLLPLRKILGWRQ